MNKSKQPVMRSLARVVEWEANPRRGKYRGIEELKASLLRVGLQDEIHVWERVEGDFLLKGHRRTRAMKELEWTECLQVVHHFDDERDAFKFLLEDHGHTVPLDGEERIVAIENGVKMGMTTADLAPMMGVSEERAQLWFDLGKLLPTGARSALAEGTLSMNVAELLLAIEDPAKRRKASAMILNDPETGEPMAFGQARAYIQSCYVLPEKWHREWLELMAKLMKRKKVVDGYHYVEWKDRLDFVLGDSGQPNPDFELGESVYPKDAEGRNWEAVAVFHQVPVYVCAAPRHAEGFVTLVNASMMRDALSVKTGLGGNPEREEDDDDLSADSAFPMAPFEDIPGPDERDEMPAERWAVKNEEAERLRVWLKTWLGAVYEHLMSKPTDAMTSGPWKPLFGFLTHLTTDVDAGALEAWRGIVSQAEALEFVNGDEKARAPLRMALLLLLCAESDASDEPEKVIREVAGALGLNAARLDKAVEAAVAK